MGNIFHGNLKLSAKDMKVVFYKKVDGWSEMPLGGAVEGIQNGDLRNRLVFNKVPTYSPFGLSVA